MPYKVKHDARLVKGSEAQVLGALCKLVNAGAAVLHHDLSDVFAVLETEDARHTFNALHQVSLSVYNILEVFVDAVHFFVAWSSFLLLWLGRSKAPAGLLGLSVTALSNGLLLGFLRLGLKQSIFLFLLFHFGFLFLFLGNVVQHDLEDLELLDECIGGVSDVDLLNDYFLLADFVGAEVDLALFRVD